jgi:hypothetical protein
VALLLFTKKSFIQIKSSNFDGLLGCQFDDVRLVFRHLKDFFYLAFEIGCRCK